jgi:hypothetical protein
LHWADDATLDLVWFLARHIAALRMSVNLYDTAVVRFYWVELA